MGAKAENLNSVIENQDSDLNLQVDFVALTDTRYAWCVQKVRSKLTSPQFRITAKELRGRKFALKARDCV